MYKFTLKSECLNDEGFNSLNDALTAAEERMRSGFYHVQIINNEINGKEVR